MVLKTRLQHLSTLKKVNRLKVFNIFFVQFTFATFYQSMSYISVFTIISTIHPTNYYYHLYKYMMFNSIVVNCAFIPFFSLKNKGPLHRGLVYFLVD